MVGGWGCIMFPFSFISLYLSTIKPTLRRAVHLTDHYYYHLRTDANFNESVAW